MAVHDDGNLIISPTITNVSEDAAGHHLIQRGSASILVGVAFAALGNLLVNFGTNVMKLGMAKKTKKTKRKDNGLRGFCPSQKFKGQKMFTESTFVWLAGAVIFVIGNVFNFSAFTFAPQSLTSAMGSLQFVSNVFFGKVLLGEHVTRKIILATLAVIFGNCCIVIFSAVSSAKTQDHSVEQILGFYTATGQLVYLCLCSVALLVLVWSSLQLARIQRSPQPSQSHCVAAIRTRKKSVSGFLYVLISALVGTQGIIQAKCFSELTREVVMLRALPDPLAAASESLRRAQHALPKVVLVWIVCSGFWLWRMNMALQRYDGLFIIPVIQLCWTCLAIVGGGIFFQEFVLFTAVQWIGFVIGLVFVFVGVWVLMSDRAGRKVAPAPRVVTPDLELGEAQASGDVDLGSPTDAPLPRLHSLAAFATDEVPLRYRPPASPELSPDDPGIFQV